MSLQTLFLILVEPLLLLRLKSEISSGPIWKEDFCLGSTGMSIPVAAAGGNALQDSVERCSNRRVHELREN